MSRSRILSLLTAGAALTAVAGPFASGAAAHSVPPPLRPHSHVVTYDRGLARVTTLTMAVTRADRRLHARVELAVHNDSTRTLHRVLRVGRCTGGAPAAPVCPPSASVPVTIAPGATSHVVRRVTLRQPPARPDAVQAALVDPATRQPYGYHSDGLLLLKGGAWRGTGAGRTYGVQIPAGSSVRRVNFDVPLVATDHAYIDVKWTGPLGPAAVPTAISRCTGATCTPRTLAPDRSRSGPQEFGNRFDFTRGGADALGLTIGAPGQPALLTATLPWPR